METIYSILLLKQDGNQKPQPVIKHEIDPEEYKLLQDKFKGLARQTFDATESGSRYTYMALEHSKENCFVTIKNSIVNIPKNYFLKLIEIVEDNKSKERYTLIKEAITTE